MIFEDKGKQKRSVQRDMKEESCPGVESLIVTDRFRFMGKIGCAVTNAEFRDNGDRITVNNANQRGLGRKRCSPGTAGADYDAKHLSSYQTGRHF